AHDGDRRRESHPVWYDHLWVSAQQGILGQGWLSVAQQVIGFNDQAGVLAQLGSHVMWHLGHENRLGRGAPHTPGVNCPATVACQGANVCTFCNTTSL